MVYDSIANASIPTAASNAKDFGKKKRVNRTAKLKQCKLDVRREQWLSQVKKKGFKEETNGSGGLKMPASDAHSMVKLEIHIGEEETEGLMNNYSDSESPSNSPTSHTSSGSGSNRSVANFSGSSGRSSSGSSSSSGGCFSGSITDEDDGCLDDWEAMADALAADDVQNTNLESPEPQLVSPTAPEPEPMLTNGSGQEGAPPGFRAWRPDDTSRPQTLPNLLKQNSFPMTSGSHFAPSSCPICCEDLDFTDSSFLPCPCGYRLCLFCHKRILEDNGRCPGCRKQYDQPDQVGAPTKLARSSTNPRH